MGSECGLYSIKISPWSLRARWALELCGIKYKIINYIPGLSEIGLRIRLGDFFGRISAPVLFIQPKNGKQHKVLKDSLQIAEWGNANRVNGVPDLFPKEHLQELYEWCELADIIMNYGRYCSLKKVLQSQDAQKEVVPDILKWCGFIGLWIVRYVTNQILVKYSKAGGGPDKEKARAALVKVQKIIKNKPNGYLVNDSFSYADIVVAVATFLFSPPEERIYPAKKHTRQTIIIEEFVEEFGDVLLWRDQIVQQYFWKNTQNDNKNK